MYRVAGGRAFSNRMGHSTHVTLVSKSQLYYTALAFLEQFTYKCSSFVECPHSRKCSLLPGGSPGKLPLTLAADFRLTPESFSTSKERILLGSKHNGYKNYQVSVVLYVSV
jgi:hypothetical protein